MTTLREAAQQALASLEEWADAYPHRADDDDLEAINALRAALEEPQSTHSADCYQWHHKCAIAEVERLRAALEEPVQEPVAWMYVNSDGECEQIEHETPPDDPSVTPLYTAPPQRKPLTEVELEMAYREIWRDLPTDFDHTSSGWIEQGIKYAERAHGIGETK